MHIFGPIPSRRLGKSLGVNIIPPGHCSYSCLYCQLGRTSRMRIKPVTIPDLDSLLEEIEENLQAIQDRGEGIDYLTIVADGEPTLAAQLGVLLEGMRKFGIKTAVITNSSLLWDAGIRNDLGRADWVSLKCDSVVEDTWRKLDRPHHLLELEKIKKGMIEFARGYEGVLVTETMLVKNINTEMVEMEKAASFIRELSPEKAYLSIPTRPPAEGYVGPPSYDFINRAYGIFIEMGLKAEYLIGYEGNEFASSGDIDRDILSISSVHPLKREAVAELLRKSNQEWSRVDKLLTEGKIIETEFAGSKYYIRRFKKDKFD